MYLITFQAVAYIITPVLFCPQADDPAVLLADISKVFKFIINRNPKKKNLAMFWEGHELKDRDYQNQFGRHFVVATTAFLPLAGLLLVSSTNFINYGLNHISLLLLHGMLTLAIASSGTDNALSSVWLLLPVLWLTVVLPTTAPFGLFSAEAFVGLLLFILAMRFLHAFFCLVISVFGSCIGRQRYNKLVMISFSVFLQYHLHFFTALVIVTAQFCVQV